MPSDTVENYIKEIYLAQRSVDSGTVAMGVVSRALNVVPGTATSMIKSLSEAGLVRYEPRVGVHLSDQGERLALKMLRRHRLIELFLVRTLGLDWADIHEEAERLEHAVSDQVLDSLDEFLGRPKYDPHGDPIPSADGIIDDRELQSLADCPLEESFEIARILDQESSFLKFIDRHHLRPGTRAYIRDRSAVADALTVVVDNESNAVTLGLSAARKILVER